jgi:hypothetical protein
MPKTVTVPRNALGVAGPSPVRDVVVRLDVTPPWWKDAQEWARSGPDRPTKVVRYDQVRIATSAALAVLFTPHFPGFRVLQRLELTEDGVMIDVAISSDVGHLSGLVARAAELRQATAEFDPRPER